MTSTEVATLPGTRIPTQTLGEATSGVIKINPNGIKEDRASLGLPENTHELNGHVFQLQLEQKNGQFQETLEQLHIHAFSMYKKDTM